MKSGPGRRRKSYFQTPVGAPDPVIVRVSARIHFSDVDPMAVLWHGRYAKLFEQANEQVGRLCGMSYEDFFRAKLRAPIVQLHVDYFAPVILAEEVTIVGRLFWNDAARMDIEYEVFKENGTLAATGYTVQMFVNESGEALLVPSALQIESQRRWLDGDFHQEVD